MDSSVDMLIKDLKDKKIAPREAVEKYSTPARHVSEIDVSDMRVQTIPSGFPTLDEDYMLLKHNRSELIIVGARPSQGKSAFMFQMAKHVAKDGNVLIFSLEMDTESIMARMLAGESGKGLKGIYKGYTKYEDLKEAHKYLTGLNLFIDDKTKSNAYSIRAAANDFHAKRPLSLVVIDYLQLVKSRNLHNKNDEVGDTTAEFKQLARDIGCPVVVGSQLNRECERRGKVSGDYKPIMADLRDSGNIEQDADIVVFLSRQEMYDGTRPGEVDVVVGKNRNGQTGNEVFKFSRELTKFFDYKEQL